MKNFVAAMFCPSLQLIQHFGHFHTCQNVSDLRYRWCCRKLSGDHLSIYSFAVILPGNEMLAEFFQNEMWGNGEQNSNLTGIETIFKNKQAK